MTRPRLYVYTPWIAPEDVRAITRVAKSGWISSLGPEVGEFERAVADWIGVKHAVATMNGTTALHIILAALGIGPGDEVIVPNLTFIATASAVVYTGATPVLADVRAEDWNLDPASVSRLVTKRTRAVIPVHLYGNPANCEDLKSAAPRAVLVEDAAEAFGAEREGRRAGALGRAAALSFYANKIITTGEGGMVTTDDARLAKRIRFLRDHAMSRERRYFHPEIGWNYRITALQAAIGLSQLTRVERILSAKTRIADGYRERLAGIPGIEPHPVPPKNCRGAFWMYSILLPDKKTRDRVAAALERERIETRPFFIPLSSLPPLRNLANGRDLPVSIRLSRRGLNLPSGPRLTSDDLDRVTSAIGAAMRSRRGPRPSSRSLRGR
jgi:perosamine synthetase